MPIKVLLFLSIFILQACSYRFANKDRQFVDGYKLVAVPVFKNSTDEPSIEVFFTNALKKEINRSKIADITNISDAPITIQGTISNITFAPGAQSSIDLLPANSVLNIEYRIYVTTDINIIRNSDKKTIWHGTFSGEQSYLAPQIGTSSINSSNALYNHSARLQNLDTMSKDIMNEAFDRMTESF